MREAGWKAEKDEDKCKVCANAMASEQAKKSGWAGGPAWPNGVSLDVFENTFVTMDRESGEEQNKGFP